MITNLLLFLLMALSWGVNWLPLKVASEEMSPLLLTALRNLVAGALLLAYSRSVPTGLLRDWRFLASVFTMIVFSGPLLFWALRRMPSSIAAVTSLSLMPVFAALFSAMYAQDRIDASRIAAMALGIAGLLVFFAAKLTLGTVDIGLVLGLAAVLASAAGVAWGSVVCRPLVAGIAPAAFAGWQMLFGGIACFALALILEPVGQSLTTWPSARLLAALGYMVVLASIVGATIFVVLLDRWGPFRVSLHAFVTPVFAVVVGVALLGETFGPIEMLGALLMFGATLLALRPAR